MNNRSHEDIARNAWYIYKIAQRVQDKLLESFLDDFRMFIQQEQNYRAVQGEVPF